MRRVLPLSLFLTGMPAAAEPPEAVLPGWLSGCWVAEAGERWTEECWTAPRGGIMLGSGRSGKGDKLGSWEVMQIAAEDGALAFWGAPKAQGRTRFAGVAAEAGVTFVNSAHDYPQRVRYWREGELLKAEVSLADGSKAQRWTYRRQGGQPTK